MPKNLSRTRFSPAVGDGQCAPRTRTRGPDLPRRGHLQRPQAPTTAGGAPLHYRDGHQRILGPPPGRRVATAGPAVRPVWFIWEEGAFWWLTGAYSRLERDIAEDPRMALVVDTCDPATGECVSVTCRGAPKQWHLTGAGRYGSWVSTSAGVELWPHDSSEAVGGPGYEWCGFVPDHPPKLHDRSW
ncbi:pyridoxamine 5'-phosphate oxidase family protein [Streptomyces cirratus]